MPTASHTFALAVYGAPFSSQASYSALNFAHALQREGHRLTQVFFYQDAVYHAHQQTHPPQDEVHLTQAWQALAQSTQAELLVCVAAAVKRGIFDAQEAQRYQDAQANLAQGFQLVGLGQLLDALHTQDRLIVFGGA